MPVTQPLIIAGAFAMLSSLIAGVSAQNVAFREGEEAKLGRLPLVVVASAIGAALLLTFVHGEFIPDAAVIGALAGGLAASVWVDVKIMEVPDVAVMLIGLVAIGDAIARGGYIELVAGVASAGVLLFFATRTRVLKEGDVKIALSIGAALGGLFGVVAIFVGFAVFAAVHFYRRARSPVPITTRMPWMPFLAVGTLSALGLALTPLAPALTVALP